MLLKVKSKDVPGVSKHHLGVYDETHVAKTGETRNACRIMVGSLGKGHWGDGKGGGRTKLRPMLRCYEVDDKGFVHSGEFNISGVESSDVTFRKLISRLS